MSISQFRNLTSYAERRLVSTATTTQYAWLTEWMSSDGVDNIRAVIKAKNASGSGFLWQPVIQYAPVRSDNPANATPTALGQQQNSSAEYNTGDVSVAGVNSGNSVARLFRLGVAYSSSSASVQQADVSMVAAWKSVGTILSRRQVTLQAVDNGIKYEPLTQWVPATYMTKIKAAFMLSGITGATSNFRYQLAYQVASTSIQQPGVWTLAEGANSWTTPSSANDERNTGEISATPTEMWIRLGVAYGMTSGVDTNVTAFLDAICSCR